MNKHRPETDLQTLCRLWKELGDVPVDEEDCLDEDFYRFAKGTHREDVWHWFEAQNSKFIVGEVMQGNICPA